MFTVRRRDRPVHFVLVCLTIALILLNTRLPSLAQSPSAELRGVWLTNVDSQVLFDRSQANRALRQLHRLHFNTLYPAVWNWGYTLYPSAIAQQEIGYVVDPRVTELQGRDILAEWVDRGHRRGFAVIPWFEFGFMTTAESELARVHPDWITQRRDGSQIWQDGIHQRRWLNPFKPEVQQFILSLILEIITQYDVDGIQFDDHFGLPAELGYDPFTVQLYRQEHQGRLPPANSQDAEWVQWRSSKLTSFMTEVFRQIKAVKSDVLISLSPNNYPFSYQRFLQDWRLWERRGLIEELIIQVYRDDLAGFVAELERPEVQVARRHIPTAVGVLTGLKDRPIGMSQVQEQVQATRSLQMAGVSFFFYETLWNLTTEPAVDRQAILRTLFSAPALRPSLLQHWTPPS
jgi:uncharacterized lipoprotein YddW (UPF0748 family)